MLKSLFEQKKWKNFPLLNLFSNFSFKKDKKRYKEVTFNLKENTMNKYRFLILLFLLVSSGAESISPARQLLGEVFSDGELTEAEQAQLNKELIEASKKGDIKKIEELIDKGADVEATDSWGQTALFMAPSLEVVNALLDKGAEIDARNDTGKTALFMAPSLEVVNALLDKGAEIDAQDKDGRTPLIRFAGRGDIDIVNALIDKRADIHVKTHYNETAVYIASQNGHHEVVSILSKKGANVNVKDRRSGNTALIVAVENNHIKVVEVLSDNGADVHAQNNRHQMALPFALKYNRLESIKILKEAAVKVQNMFGRTDLIEAASQGQLDIMNDLIEKGADINAQDNEGRTALWWAVYEKQLEAVNTLLANGADVSIKDNNDTKPLNIADMWRHNEIKKALMEVITDQWALVEAASQGQLNTVKALIEKGVDINAKGEFDEETALIAAIDAIVKPKHRDIDKELFEVVNFLIEKGADIDATDRWGKSVLMYALSSPEAVNTLVKNGVNVNNGTDRVGQTPLMYALHQSSRTPPEVVDILLDNEADVHATTKGGVPVLMYALSPEHVNALVKKGANVDVTDKDGKTALMLAAWSATHDGRLIKVVHALIENGANMQITDKDGKTVLMLAKDHGHFEVVKILEEAQKKSACRRKF